MIPIIYNVRNLAVRKTTTIAAAGGIALVAFVLSTALMMAHGVVVALGKSGSPDMAIVLRKGSDAELASGVASPQVGLLLTGPGVKKDPAGAPIGVSEVVIVVTLEKLGANGEVSNVQVRGVPENVLKLRSGIRVVMGRQARAGTDEAMVGKGIHGRFRGLELGGVVELRKGRTVRVVGVFEDSGSSFESELWCDLDTLRTAFGREGSVSSVRVQLESPDRFDAFKTFVEKDPQLGLEVMRELEYYKKQSESLDGFVRILGWGLSFLFSVGAMIGAMITMQGSVADREREIGTLRALGFSRRGILVSFLLESTMLAVIGGLVGVALSMCMSLIHFSMINLGTWSELTFTFQPEPGISIKAMVCAVMMGLCGGFIPALRASRISPAQAMHD